MKPGTFYGLGVDDTLTRSLQDQTPITFNWAIEGISQILAYVAFDNINFVDCVGTMVLLPSQKWQLEYHPQDRPTNPGMITYKFVDNLDNADILPLVLTGTPVTQEDIQMVLSEYGPKRIKTKEMEIEQFDPRILDEVDERKRSRLRRSPSFCCSSFCIGEGMEERVNRCTRG